MNGLLVRIGVDHAYGGWNAPMDPESGHFVYIPIPEKRAAKPGMERPFRELLPRLECFCQEHKVQLNADLNFPASLVDQYMHLDPDFDFLTYGDGGRRAAGLRTLTSGDLVVFYAGLRPIRPCGQRLVYALVGLYVADEIILRLSDVPRERWKENAHTRRLKAGRRDVMVRGRRGVSGRLDRCVGIGEWREGAYRVRRDVLESWGGLSVKDGYIQRSVVPPSFVDPGRFYDWFLQQNRSLLARNA